MTICLSLHEPFYRLFHFGGVRQHSREHAMNIFRDLTKLRRRRQGERQKNNRFNEQNNNPARASRLFCTLLCCTCTTTTWNDHTLSLLEYGNDKAINSTISVWTQARPPLFESSQNSLLLTNRANWVIAKTSKRMRSLFWSDVFMDVAVVGS